MKKNIKFQSKILSISFFLATNSILILFLMTAQGQQKNDFNANSKLTLLKTYSEDIKEQRFFNLDFRRSTKSSNREGTIVIKRIIKNLTTTQKEMYEDDTLVVDIDNFIHIDTDFPIPDNEDNRYLVENTLLFVNKPVNLVEDENGNFKPASKIKKGQPNIFFNSIQYVPTFNKNFILSTTVLDFDAEKTSVIDTVLSERYAGIFITKYIKNETGYDVEGELQPVKNQNSEEKLDPNIATETYQKYKYKGKFMTNKNFITKIDIEVDLKMTYDIPAIKLKDVRENKYRLVVENIFNQ